MDNHPPPLPPLHPQHGSTQPHHATLLPSNAPPLFYPANQPLPQAVVSQQVLSSAPSVPQFAGVAFGGAPPSQQPQQYAQQPQQQQLHVGFPRYLDLQYGHQNPHPQLARPLPLPPPLPVSPQAREYVSVQNRSLLVAGPRGTPIRAGQGEGEVEVNDEGLWMVRDPPDLREWRERLFALEEVILISEEQYKTYFPHVDNIYSHRSTQKYKRKPFVTHYWDCRLKGRPSGTPKTNDPDKKKRNRLSRGKDLCDMKIKITEYMAGSTAADIISHLRQQQQSTPKVSDGSVETPAGPIDSNLTWQANFVEAHMSPSGISEGKFYTVQRVSAMNARGELVTEPHRHSLEESDRIKKNSVQRWMQKTGKVGKKRPSVSFVHDDQIDRVQNTFRRKFKPALL